MGALPKTRMTVPEFFAWWDKQRADDRYELVDGQVVAMGRDRVTHNRAKMRALAALASGIAKAGVDCEAFIDGVGVSPNVRNYRLPDVVVNCGDVDPDASLVPDPVIVVEIVSARSEDRDVHTKLTEYFTIESVTHYLIIYPEKKVVVHHRRMAQPARVETAFISSGEIDLSPPGLQVKVSDLLGSSGTETREL
jgi:Uma2 family endonuclease